MHDNTICRMSFILSDMGFDKVERLFLHFFTIFFFCKIPINFDDNWLVVLFSSVFLKNANIEKRVNRKS